MVLLRRYWVQLTADRRKFSALCVMLGIGLLLWARLIVISNMPRTAVAEPHTTDSKQARMSNAKAMSDKIQGPTIVVSLDTDPRRDPFIVCDDQFPRPTSLGRLPGEAAKLQAEQTEDPEQVEARFRARIQAIIDQLALEAAMSSASLAVIDGLTYRIGESVKTQDGERRLKLVEVKKRSVILEYERRRFELKMNVPGG